MENIRDKIVSQGDSKLFLIFANKILTKMKNYDYN